MGIEFVSHENKVVAIRISLSNHEVSDSASRASETDTSDPPYPEQALEPLPPARRLEDASKGLEGGRAREPSPVGRGPTQVRARHQPPEQHVGRHHRYAERLARGDEHGAVGGERRERRERHRRGRFPRSVRGDEARRTRLASE